MKKLRKNKLLVLVICVVVLSTVYFVAQKAIDSYVFNTNGDIVSESEGVEGDTLVESDGGSEGSTEVTEDGSSQDSTGQFPDEEMDLVLEEAETEGETGDVDDSGSAEGDESNSGEGKNVVEVEKIYVYITGEVNCPGVVILNEGSRIVDAINAAGGTTAKANVSKVNLVYVLEDGMKVNIPNNNDLKNNPDFEYITMNSGDGVSDDYSVSSSSGNGSAGSDSSAGNSSGSGSSRHYSVVNINTATQTELETLPGIGPSLALKIINYRKENGKFSSIDEIKNVSGIGESKFEDLKAYVTI